MRSDFVARIKLWGISVTIVIVILFLLGLALIGFGWKPKAQKAFADIVNR